MPSRPNNRKTSAMIVVMQWVHDGDLPVELLELRLDASDHVFDVIYFGRRALT